MFSRAMTFNGTCSMFSQPQKYIHWYPSSSRTYNTSTVNTGKSAEFTQLCMSPAIYINWACVLSCYLYELNSVWRATILLAACIGGCVACVFQVVFNFVFGKTNFQKIVVDSLRYLVGYLVLLSHLVKNQRCAKACNTPNFSNWIHDWRLIEIYFIISIGIYSLEVQVLSRAVQFR